MKLTISEAARRAGVTRVTLYKKIKSGELSKEMGDDGKPIIELSELARVYPQAVNTQDASTFTDDAAKNSQVYSLLQAEINHLKQVVAIKDEQIEEIRADKSALREQLQATTRLLSDLRPSKPSEEKDAIIERQAAHIRRLEQQQRPVKKKGFWAWLN